ncbi:uncharacterized protein [Oryza sativa Japonica Group]|jgi:hypothetical protein|uniref:Uncharacterized protein n=1 Tax=Oryza sativa subsp. japonica TaxID=39947 RepID=Q5KQJ7_ORYSJ|nr:uncharacterized protein LOC4337987 [Oryza sativa Japonica Group]AAW57814.1 unknown protein [Oryza sativa Japonica Group]KAF2929441.1 hypothetical protein DAI22_05g057600 [Oryza sativa Japonica Group]
MEGLNSLKAEEQHCHGGGGGRVSQAIAMLVATAVTAQAAYRARHAPWDLAFVLFAYADLGLLFPCLSMYERLPPLEQEEDGDDDSAAVRRRRRSLKMAVWALSTALSAAFAWRVAAVMPAPAMKAAVWGMTSTVAVAGFYLLFVHRPAAISSYSELDTCKHEQASSKLDQIL